MIIVIPSLSTSNALSFCQKLPNHDRDNTYYFDVSNVNNYEPLPMLLVAAAIRQFRKDRSLAPQQVQLRYTDNSDFQYACHMGFFQSAGFPEGKPPGKALGSSTYIPLTRISIRELQQQEFKSGNFADQGEIIEKEAKKLSEILSQGQDELQKLLQYLLREAIRNIPEHAETDDVWLCGQYWHNRDLAEIAILDEGIGIFKSISHNQVHRAYISSNEEALRWALKPGVSVAFIPSRGKRNNNLWANSGYGLYMISEICKLTEGWFTLASGDDCIRVYPDNTNAYPVHYNGTALGIRIKPSKIRKCQAIIDEARTTGEIMARTIKTAFKEASTPSKGLLF